MKNLTKHLLYKGTDIGRQNVVWNIAGSFVYALASMVLSFLVIRVVGDGQGGIFSFGFSTLGQQMFIVAYFGIRPFQIPDGTGEYSFGDYLEHRNITCIMALAAGAVFLTFMHGVGRYPADKCMILILLVIYKVIDGYADVYESEFQRQGSLYLTGKSNFFRTLFSVSVFLVTLAAFEHARMNDAASGYFNLIFMPTSVIYMVANFVIRPFLTRLTDLWTGRDYDCFKKELMRIGAIILGLTVLAVGATAVLGKWVLSVMEMILGSGYEGRLVSYYGAFIIIVLGGGFYALANLMYYALVIMRRQKAIFTVYLAAAAAAAVLSGLLVSKFGINGAAGCYLLLMIGLVIGFGLYTAGAYQSEKKENAGNGGSNT